MSRHIDPVSHVLRHVWQGGELVEANDQVATETPVALVYNGISHVVMMSTPSDLEDFVTGFSLSEDIIASTKQILDVEEIVTDKGIELHMTIVAEAFSGLKERRRNLVGRTGCGLCGAESLDQAIPNPKSVINDLQFSHIALQAAIVGLANWQELQKQTGAVHAAAWCDREGNILVVREDVGRHNALDKLIGAIARGIFTADGFVLVTSRASYEMVSKTANANIALLAAVSAPTSLAIDLAKECGLTLVGFSRPDRHVIYANGQRIESD
jgi:FdhD protein|tara:strand:+ start:4420 stop:5226 length:807 start_codon:yes stop_codon:yes gene_type:complete